ncbi:hypothetical protein ASZ78_003051, partial [Callipepla squamata]
MVRFSLGDARRPLHESAILVEDIVHTQLINLMKREKQMGKDLERQNFRTDWLLVQLTCLFQLATQTQQKKDITLKLTCNNDWENLNFCNWQKLQQAAEVSQLRGARVISAEDLLFLMRKDKKKLRRLLKYMFFRDYKSKIVKGIEEDDLIEDKFSSSNTNKRQKLAQDFLNSIDQTGELLAMFEDDEIDDVKQERMEVHRVLLLFCQRAERQTRMMDSVQYAEFCESRQLSFSKKASKFRDWLDCSSMEIKPNVVAMEILAYLAYETVAQLVDLALLVKQDMTPKAGDPFSHAISATFIQYHNSTEPHLLGQAAGGKTGLESPENTPPPTPTPPAPAGQQHLGKTPSGALGNGGIGQDSSKSKQRKRKKSAAACGMEAQSDAIQPSHIREAIRRYGHKIGPLSPFT